MLQKFFFVVFYFSISFHKKEEILKITTKTEEQNKKMKNY